MINCVCEGYLDCCEGDCLGSESVQRCAVALRLYICALQTLHR